jgi:sialate O-acetylesterase
VGASSWVENPRVYEIGPGTLKAGRNVIAVRIFIHGNGGGFLSPAETLRIQFPDGASVPLAGVWRVARSVDAPPPHPQPLDTENYPTMPAVLYNGMIAPIAPLSLTGAIWYQGEANTSRPRQYRKLLPALIADWRRAFGQGDFPFYIAGLPAFTRHRPEPGSDGWAELREAQELAVRTTPGTGLAVTIDTGEADNIHPKEKQIVGDRLAWCALAQHYGVDVPHSGPEFASVQKLPGALRLHFVQTGGGLVAHGGSLAGFAVAGEDRVWHWADARIDHDDVIASAAAVPSPVAARYAWQANPEASLFNAEGFPAAPFRTDDWPLGD